MNIQNLLKQFSNFNMPNMANNESNNGSQNQSNIYPESFSTSDFNQNPVSNMTYNNQNSTKSQSPLNNLFGQNSGISSLLGLLPLLKGKQNMGSLLSADNLPDNFKNLAPFISMLSNTSEKKAREDDQKIDNYKKIEE